MIFGMKKFCLAFIFVFSAISLSAQKNVIVLIADDLGTDYFGFYENHQDTVDVPAIRSLLSKGVRFKNAMSNPVCSSTRAGMLTGRYSFRTGVGYIVGSAAGSGTLDTSEFTIPRLLTQFNPTLKSANIGKWHLHNPNPAINLTYPNVLGYSHFEGPFIGALNSYTNWTKYINGVPTTVTHYATSENVDNAISWLKTSVPASPFYLWLAFNAPHSPYHLPPASLHNYTSLTGTAQHIQQNPKEYFKAMLQALDTEIGRLMDSLQVLNKLDSTYFIFVGDNGNTLQTNQIANLNHGKGTIYQYGVNVPLLIAGPGIVNPGRSSDALVNTVDVFATVLELIGDTAWKSQLPLATSIDSKSLLPILMNQSAPIRDWAFCEIFRQLPDIGDGKAIRNLTYKLIKFDSGIEEFYNLSTDPNENVNLLSSSLNSTEQMNYTFLCNELVNLLNNGMQCNSGVGITQNFISTLPEHVFPNPFFSKIEISEKQPQATFELTSCLGEIIYSGKDIELEDFSTLPAGLYFLKINSITRNHNLKLIHY